MSTPTTPSVAAAAGPAAIGAKARYCAKLVARIASRPRAVWEKPWMSPLVVEECGKVRRLVEECLRKPVKCMRPHEGWEGLDDGMKVMKQLLAHERMDAVRRYNTILRREYGDHGMIQWVIPHCGVHKHFRQRCSFCVQLYRKNVDMFTLLGILKKQLYDDVGGRGPHASYFTLNERSSHGIIKLVQALVHAFEPGELDALWVDANVFERGVFYAPGAGAGSGEKGVEVIDALTASYRGLLGSAISQVSFSFDLL